MVGHTHEDVDQLFSRISQRLARNDAHTIADLSDEIKRSYTPSPVVEQIRRLFDIKTVVSDLLNDVSGHSEPHQFKIEKNKDGIVSLFYKKWSTKKDWKEANLFFETDRIVLDEIMTEPKTMPLVLEKVKLEKLEKDIPRYKVKFSASTEEWWGEYINSLRTRASYPEKEQKIWGIPFLTTTQAARPIADPSLPIESTRADEEIERHYAKERRDVMVRFCYIQLDK